MKKQIAVIIISLLAAGAVSAQNVNTDASCTAKKYTPRHSVPDFIVEQNIDLPWNMVLNKGLFSCIPVYPEKPSEDDEAKPETPPSSEEITPDTPEIPDTPDVPVTPEQPDTPEIPDTPEEPSETPEETPSDTPISEYAKAVFDLVNNERAKVGIAALTYDNVLEQAASVRAREIKTLFSHTRPNGSRCFTVLDEIGYNYRGAGENIAYGQQSPKEVMTAWMNSQGHRENILNPSFTHIGIGVNDNGTVYWAQMFAY